MGGGIGYLHRNIFKGGELFNIKIRGTYEAVTPSFSSFEKNYFEISTESSLTYPRFMFPFLTSNFKKKIHASTQLEANYAYQRRPGYFTRTVLSSGVKYIWQDRIRSLDRHIFNLVDISYIQLPQLNPTFYDKLSEAAKVYSFKDHFILSSGYTFSRTNAGNPNRRNQSIYSTHASVETAGHLLALIANLTHVKPDSLGSKQIFSTNFSQYIKGTLDYSKTYQVDEKNSIAWHIGGGIAYPYGNSKQLPIQKRFFAGGANNVRGWAIRSLGPGAYYNPNPNIRDNFYYHSGDISLNGSIEYRSKLFWVLELGAFVDAGNIWTIKKYDDQPRGDFKFDSFYKEIAVSWGLGVRLNFDFVLLRLDGGWKAYDPSGDPNITKWPLFEPYKISKNTAFHIAIGYPF